MVTSEDVTTYLLNIGVSTGGLGFEYLRDAIMIALEDADAIREITGYLYPAVGHRHGTTGSRAERVIRYAIETAWTFGNIDYQQRVFGYSISPEKGKPTNRQFVQRSVDHLKQQANAADSFDAAPDELKAEFLSFWRVFREWREGVRV